MATLALSVAGQFAGALLGGPFGATIGRALGALAGSAIDGMLFGGEQTSRAADLRLTGSSEGIPVPRLYGWGRLSGNIIWARELERLGGETSGSKGMGSASEDEVGASFAIGFCEGPVARLGRIWADGQLLDTRGLTLRFYGGDEGQLPDSLIEATQGGDNAPAYRGLCYLVVENLPLSRFGNRIPQITAELCRVVGTLEPDIRAITVIPGASEFGYDPTPRLRVVGPGEAVSENAHLVPGVSDWTWSIDELVALCPNLKHVALVVSWFGSDLRCGHCTITPRVEASQRTVEGTSWSVAGIDRAAAATVSSHGGGPAFGGTPSDNAVLAAIADLKARGLKVTLYPLMQMDVPGGNGLPDPYGGSEQGSYPWRGRITCHPAPGVGGSPDQGAGAASQVAAFVPGYRDMILHYAGLAVTAGGVDTYLIGSEMRGMTTVRGPGHSFPFVDALVSLAEDVRAIVGSSTKLTYAADWSEYSGYQPAGAKYFHLDPLWASPEIDAIGIDNYMPLSDWRDGLDHTDAGQGGPHDIDYLASNIAGGEGFDWYYASDAHRAGQVRSPIVDGGHGEHWIWRYKDLVSFWSEPHYNRPGGVRSASPTAWVPESKPIWMTELGCGAVDKASNQPNIFGDDKSAEGGRPYFSSGQSDALVQRQFLRAHFRHWADPALNPPGMVDLERIYCWTWDARPYPAFPAQTDVWSDGPNHHTGHWLTGRLGALASDELVSAMAADHGCAVAAQAVAPLIGGYLVSGPGTARDAIVPVLDMTRQTVRAEAGALLAQAAAKGTPTQIEAAGLAAQDEPQLSQRRDDSAEVPARLALSVIDRERDYQSTAVLAQRSGDGPLVVEAMPVVLDPAGTRQVAERLLHGQAGSRDRLEFSLPLNRVDLEPGDRIVVEGAGEAPYEITEIRDGLTRRIVARSVPVDRSIAVGVTRRSAGGSAPSPAIPPHLVVAHLPAAPDNPSRSRLAIGAYARPWPGHVRLTDTVTGAQVADLFRPAVTGTTMAALAPGPAALWDQTAVLDVTLHWGHLADVTPEAALSGSNRIAVETDAGVWEVIGFAEADLVVPRRYHLRRLLRGLNGTEPAIGPVAAGRRVMVLDDRVVSLLVEPGRIGSSLALRSYAGSTDADGSPLSVTLGAAPALPLPPAHLRTTRLSNGSIQFDWVRRSRADSNDWGMAEPDLEHAPEAWRLRIRSGGVLKRTINAGVTTAIYSAALQTTDFGGPATGFTYEIAQISAAIGAGHVSSGAFND
ncbi:MAG: glycoside hydrolase/phage tail family protein [Devosia sp.]|uniref:baseplate multidomain protein megatron n=1 Tax=Devosia sp. TaxID=1871048 RepID=UPI0024CB73E2|nr:glycoside hydrolase/phage tail family protein [Devosia sp.]UYN99708.1 MAG: glycoside hydrolase/phage tail family protein [Devosia sp.]